jgi:RimJ/RimL family protein N-acetyltransferase
LTKADRRSDERGVQPVVDAANRPPVLNITGQLVALGPLRADLLPLYTRWRNDFTVQRTKDDPPQPVTEEQYRSIVEAAGSGAGQIWFTIYQLPALRPVGVAGLTNLEFRHRSAEYAVQIGEADARGIGLGTETTRLLLAFAFDEIGLNSVFLRVFAFNYAGRRAYARAGFREFGIRRQAWAMNGRLWDVVYMECLASEFDMNSDDRVTMARASDDFSRRG